MPTYKLYLTFKVLNFRITEFCVIIIWYLEKADVSHMYYELSHVQSSSGIARQIICK